MQLKVKIMEGGNVKVDFLLLVNVITSFGGSKSASRITLSALKIRWDIVLSALKPLAAPAKSGTA